MPNFRLLALLLLCPLCVAAQGSSPVLVRKYEPPTVRLLEPGREPHKALRYRWRAAKVSASVTTEGVWELFTNGMTNNHQFPVMSLHLVAKPPKAKGASAVVEVEWLAPVLSAPEGAKEAPPLDATTRLTLEAIEGLRSELELGPTGLLRELRQWPGPKDLKANAAGQMETRSYYAMEVAKGALKQLLVPFPEEPVGLGARWQVEQWAMRGTIPLLHVVNYELLSVRGEEVELSVRLGAKPDPATPYPPDEVLVQQSGSGRVRLSLGSPFPLEASEEALLRMHLGGKTRGEVEHRGLMRTRAKAK